MTFDRRAAFGPVHRGAIASAVLGVLSTMSIGFPPGSLPLAVAAIVMSFVSRRALKADTALRGARLSLIGLLTGIGAFLAFAVSLGAPFLLQFIADATAGS